MILLRIFCFVLGYLNLLFLLLINFDWNSTNFLLKLFPSDNLFQLCFLELLTSLQIQIKITIRLSCLIFFLLRLHVETLLDPIDVSFFMSF